MSKLQRWALIVSILVGASALAAWPTGLANNFVEHFQTVGANAKWIALAEFKRLSAIRKVRKLTVEEWSNWCYLGQRLGYWTRCPAL